MLLDTIPPPLDEVREILVDIRRDDERAHEVVGGMRALLQRREFQVEPLNLNVTIAQVLPLLQGEAQRRSVVLRADLADGLPDVEGDRVHLQQVVLNLVMNGIEAAGTPRQEGRVIVRTSLRDGTDVHVTVIDTGGGIPGEGLPRIFEAFFTTKNDGLGLGLSIARSLVELHRGRIWAENHPNGGAMFHFVLPGRQRA
jgi:signal transduction histidine kinase